MTYILLLIVGVGIFVPGLLVAAHPPFQYWWYCFREIDKTKLVPRDSEEYKDIAFHLKIRGGGVGLIGGLITIHALGELGGERLILIAGFFFVCGLLLVGLVRLWQRVTSPK